MSDPTPIYPVDRVFYMGPNGNDANAGTQAAPFLTLGAANTAITKARWARPTTSNDCIEIAAGTYAMPWPVSIDSDSVVVRAGGNGRAIFNCDQTGFNVSGHKGIHFVGIDLRATNRDPYQPGYVAREGGVGFNFIRNAQGVGCDDVSLDNCCGWWFGQGISFLGNNGQKLRVWNGSYCHNYENANGMPQKSQGIYHEGSQADIRYNVIAFNGWTGKEDLSNQAVVTALMFSHGIYCSAYGNPKPGLSQGNFYVVNAASGLQLRTGGTVFGDVYATNGIACDAFTDGAIGDIMGCLVLGNQETGLYSGGGFLGQSEHQTITGNAFLRSNPTTAAAITLGWNGSGNDITGTAKPSPTSIGAVSGNFGMYAGPVSQVSVPRAFQALTPNPIIKPAGTLPDLIDWAQSTGYTGPATHAGVVQWLRDNPAKVDAAACVAWGAKIAQGLSSTAPALPANTPATPLPMTFTVNVDSAGKASIK